MRLILIFILIFPVNVFAVDNMMINTDMPEIGFQEAPMIGMAFKPRGEPGVVISLPESTNIVIPGYRIKHDAKAFLIGISCEENLSDDCSAFPYSNDYDDRRVYIRYIQTSDQTFKTPEGSGIGDRWDQKVQKVNRKSIQYTANDSCVQLPSGWHACIDPMSVDRNFNMKTRRLMPKKSAKIDFFYKSTERKSPVQ